MASICLYLQLHQPPRLRRYSVFDTTSDYFDDRRNGEILRKVAHKCYLPTTELLLKLIERHEGRFRLAFSLTGCVIDQLRNHAPEVIERFGALAQTGCCEFLAETYHHSLAFLYSRDEFVEQLDMHAQCVEDLFGQSPSIFRNTELIYSNELAARIAGLERYRGILSEGADHVLAGRSPNHVYRPPGQARGPALLLKNYHLSDDVAFRFSDRNWREWPLTADKFAAWVDGLNREQDGGGTRGETSQGGEGTGEGTGGGTGGGAEVCGLFMDMETFGEHQWRETGIFEFLDALPGKILALGNDFRTPGECVEAYEPVGEYDVPQPISWADTERDCSAWLGNAMQASALQQLYRLEQPVKASGDDALLDDWRNLTTSDHFYYMCTKYFADQDVHKYFNPYASPYDSYINYVNVLDNLRTRAEAAAPG